MVRFTSDIAVPAISSFIAGSFYAAALPGFGVPEEGPVPKRALLLPGFGAATSFMVRLSGGTSPVSVGSYCASFSTVGWLASKLFWKQGV